MDLNQGLVGLLCSCQAVLVLVGSKLYSCLPFHQRCTDLHDHRLDGVGTTPALFCKQLHADGTTTQNIPGKESDKVTTQTDVVIPTHCSRGETSSLIRFLMEKIC